MPSRPSTGCRRGTPTLNFKARLGVASVSPKKRPMSGVTVRFSHVLEADGDRIQPLLLLGDWCMQEVGMPRSVSRQPCQCSGPRVRAHCGDEGMDLVWLLVMYIDLTGAIAQKEAVHIDWLRRGRLASRQRSKLSSSWAPTFAGAASSVVTARPL